MKHKIDPKVDCVFKALLGSEQNKNLLINFLNAVIRPAAPVVAVDLLSPFNEKTHESAKLTVVDIKAHEAGGSWFQVEIQLALHPALAERQLYTWAEVYRSQLTEGRDYKTLTPAVAIWLVNGKQFPRSSAWRHHFQLYDHQTGSRLSEHCSIFVLELPKWRHPSATLDDEGRWVYFLREAGHWTQLPTELNTREMRQAMSTLSAFSEKEREYHRYLSRLDAQRVQLTIENSMKEAQEELDQTKAALSEMNSELAETSAALQEKSAALQEKSAALQEKSAALQEKSAALQEKSAALADKDRALREAEHELSRLRSLLKTQEG